MQIAGTKQWTLTPPPECHSQCSANPINVTIHPGEALLLNTNMWYHSTLVLGDQLSIALGSEYD